MYIYIYMYIYILSIYIYYILPLYAYHFRRLLPLYFYVLGSQPLLGPWKIQFIDQKRGNDSPLKKSKETNFDPCPCLAETCLIPVVKHSVLVFQEGDRCLVPVAVGRRRTSLRAKTQNLKKSWHLGETGYGTMNDR